MKKTFYLTIFFSLFLASCQDAPKKQALENKKEKESPFSVVTTTGMITDIVAKVAGDRASVQGLIGSGVDPHLYKPTRSDIVSLNSAKIIFYNGLLLEGKLTDALNRISESGVKVVAVTESLDPSFLLSPPEFSGHYDPHVWMNPQAWIKAVEVIKNTLINFDKEGEALYQKNADELTKKLEELDLRCEKAILTIPKESRLLVTAHDAFNYFGKRYDFEVVGIQGISTESEAGVKDIEKIVNLIVEKKVKAVFVESSVPKKNIEALIEGGKARGHNLLIGGELFSDAMGEPGTYEGTYLGMIDHNVSTIVKALGGTPNS
jgi:manganese/zinc/iron transport system substrate-binding protein